MHAPDPFVQFGLRGSTDKPLKSRAKKNTVDPVWGDGRSINKSKTKDSKDSKGGEHFVLPIEPSQGSGGYETVLEAKVYDDDLVGASDFMGLATIDLETCRDKRKHRAWHELTGESGRVDGSRGEVELRLQWKHNPALAAKAEMVLPAVEADETDKSKEKGSEESDEDEVMEPFNEVLVALVRARRLPAVDRGGLLSRASSDPQVTVTLEGESRSSAVKYNDLNPIYKERFAFPVHPARFNTAAVEVEVYDVDSVGANDFMGKAAPIAIDKLTREWTRGFHRFLPQESEDERLAREIEERAGTADGEGNGEGNGEGDGEGSGQGRSAGRREGAWLGDVELAFRAHYNPDLEEMMLELDYGLESGMLTPNGTAAQNEDEQDELGAGGTGLLEGAASPPRGKGLRGAIDLDLEVG